MQFVPLGLFPAPLAVSFPLRVSLALPIDAGVTTEINWKLIS